MENSEQNLVEIYIPLKGKDWDESLGATSLGDNLYEIVEIPFYTDRLNLNDQVLCEEKEPGVRSFVKVAKSSGHKTLHFALDETISHDEWPNILASLIKHQCKYRNSGRFFAVDIPPHANIDKVLKEMEELRNRELITDEEDDGGALQSFRYLQLLTGGTANRINDD